MTEAEQSDWIEEVLLKTREGSAAPGEIDALRELLLSSPEARRTYIRYNQLTNQLENLYSGSENSLEEASPTNVVTLPLWKRIRASRIAASMLGAGIAAVIALMLAHNTASPNPFTIPVANAGADTPTATLESDYNADMDGALDSGPVSLNKGIAQIQFKNGAKIVLQGHCGFEIIDEKNVILTRGKMWAYCPPEAKNFTVSTPGGRKIIDIGTEFGVEIGLDGKADIHVFDGIVDLKSGDLPKQRITVGQSATWLPGESVATISTKSPTNFITPTELAEKRRDAYHKEMRKRQDLIIRYDFSGNKLGQLRNTAQNASPKTDARIHGSSLAAGRSPKRSALSFQKIGDGIEFDYDLPDNLKQLTIAMWVNVDRLDAPYSVLLNSADWSPGATHFQITRSASLLAGLHSGGAFITPSHTIRPGSWQLVAVSWDVEKKTARISCDGILIDSQPQYNYTKPLPKLSFSWGKMIIGGHPKIEFEGSPRQLRARVDEIMVFKGILSSSDLRKIYDGGKR